MQIEKLSEVGTDLDDILTQVDCPTCGTVINLLFRQVRIQKAAACKCGNLLRLIADPAPAAAQVPVGGGRMMSAQGTLEPSAGVAVHRMGTASG